MRGSIRNDCSSMSMDGESDSVDTRAVGLKSRIAEAGGDLRLTLDAVLSTPEKLPARDRLTVALS